MSERNADFVGHETTDAEIAPLVRFAVFLAATVIVSALVVIGLYKYLDEREQAEKAGRYPLAAGVVRPLPPPPRLQTYPFDDIKELRKEENKVLDHYAWVKSECRRRPIPIERAIDACRKGSAVWPARAGRSRGSGRCGRSDGSGGLRDARARQGAGGGEALTDVMRVRVVAFIVALAALTPAASGAQDLGPAPGERVGAGVPAQAGMPELLQEVGLDQRLNAQIPLNLTFKDESGRTVKLGDYFGSRPVILTLNY